MADEKIDEASEESRKTRRTIVRTAAQVAVTAPAVTILLAAATIPTSPALAYVNVEKGVNNANNGEGSRQNSDQQ